MLNQPVNTTSHSTRVTRRQFGMAAAGLLVASQRRFVSADNTPSAETPLFKISLAQWSLHNALFKGQIDNLDFAREAKRTYG
ncbi:MAG: sugar phosphate isomerase/epimerase, partial [Planctomycetota bacterium]|nr:sugar phosphate isomerase/epimerase [Planctomycetota bacterium]